MGDRLAVGCFFFFLLFIRTAYTNPELLNKTFLFIIFKMGGPTKLRNLVGRVFSLPEAVHMVDDREAWRDKAKKPGFKKPRLKNITTFCSK